MNLHNKLECLFTRLEKLARDKRSSLVRKFINYRQKKDTTLVLFGHTKIGKDNLMLLSTIFDIIAALSQFSLMEIEEKKTRKKG